MTQDEFDRFIGRDLDEMGELAPFLDAMKNGDIVNEFMNYMQNQGIVKDYVAFTTDDGRVCHVIYNDRNDYMFHYCGIH